MDFTVVGFYVFATISTLYVVHFGFYLTGANLYDVWHARRGRKFAAEVRAYRPLVSVIVPAHNEEKVIARCLDSIEHSSYRRVQVIVADDGSTDNTAAIVREYIAQHPGLDVQLSHKDKNIGKGGALNYALGNYVTGELVTTVDADSILLRDTIAHAVSYFVDPSIAGVAANVQLLDEHSVLGILQKFEHMIGYRSKKVYSLTNCEFVIGGVASTYRMDVLREVGFYDTDTMTEDIGLSLKIVSNGNRAYRVVYGVDVVARTESVTTFRGLMRQRYRWKYGSLQNIIKYRHLIGTNDTRFTTMLALYRMPMAVTSEIVLLFTPLGGYTAST